MTIDQTVSQISQLPIEDQLQIVHAVWEQMDKSTSCTPTSSQQEELDRRMSNYRNDPSSALTEDELRQKLKERREGL